MIKSYLKIAWRNMAANKLFTSLNIAGLGIDCDMIYNILPSKGKKK